jgi:Ni/Co efflux regulator RcnB
MKKIILSAAIAAMTFVGGAASAQGYGYDRYDRGGRYDSDRDGRSDAREWNRDRDRDGRPDQYDRYDNRRDGRHDGYRGNRWRQGQVYPYWRQRGYVIEDYRAYRLPPPRHGYRYYRSDNGDVVLAAIASGVIAAIIADQHDNDRHDRRYYGR